MVAGCLCGLILISVAVPRLIAAVSAEISVLVPTARQGPGSDVGGGPADRVALAEAWAQRAVDWWGEADSLRPLVLATLEHARLVGTKDETARRRKFSEAERYLWQSVRSRPVDPWAWAELASLSHRLAGPSPSAVARLRLSFLSNPNVRKLHIWRLERARRLKPYWTDQFRDLVRQQVLWRPPRLKSDGFNAHTLGIDTTPAPRPF